MVRLNDHSVYLNARVTFSTIQSIQNFGAQRSSKHLAMYLCAKNDYTLLRLMNFIILIYCYDTSIYSCIDSFTTACFLSVAGFGNYEIHSGRQRKLKPFLIAVAKESNNIDI